MDKLVRNNNKLVALLLEEEEDDDLVFAYSLPKKRKSTNDLLKMREIEGCYQILIKGHLVENDKQFREFFRVNHEQFQFLVKLVEEELTLLPSNRVRRPISVEEKVAVTLRYLATGESFRSLQFSFRISHSYISEIVKQTLSAMKSKLVSKFMPDPSQIDFKEKAEEFDAKWNFPNCILAIDGKHVRIRCPTSALGYLNHNYKDYFSIVLLAMVDANYKFIAVDIGSFGNEGDRGIFLKSTMGKQILDGSFGFPDDCLLPGTETTVPHVIVGNEAIRLHKRILKPYTKKATEADPAKAIFNCRLNRARRVTEKAFGILCRVFRVFCQPIYIEPEKCDDLVWVSCCLHNMLLDGYLEKNHQNFQAINDEPLPKDNIFPIVASGGFAKAEGFAVRDTFKNYFNNEGAVPWQGNNET